MLLESQALQKQPLLNKEIWNLALLAEWYLHICLGFQLILQLLIQIHCWIFVVQFVLLYLRPLGGVFNVFLSL